MNALNLVIIEGTLINGPVILEKASKQVCTFRIVSVRNAVRGGEKYQEIGFFDIEIRGDSNVAMCMSELATGRAVCVIGRMVTEEIQATDNYKMTVVSESIEIKANRKHEGAKL